MCNLYSITKGQDAIRQAFQAGQDLVGKLAPQPAVFPDQLAPVVRTDAHGEGELAMLYCGFPPPSNVAGGRHMKRPLRRHVLGEK